MARRFIAVLLIAIAFIGITAVASSAPGPTGADFLRLCEDNKLACTFYVAGFAQGAAAASVKRGANASCTGVPRAYVHLNRAFQAFLEAARQKGDLRALEESTPILLARFMTERGLCIGSPEEAAAAPDSRAAGKEAQGR
jgi:hypothetical protein